MATDAILSPAPVPVSRSAFAARVLRIAKKKWVIALTISSFGIGGWAWTKSHAAAEPPRYVLEAVTKGTLITSVSGSGQVSGESQLEIKPSVSGEVLSILVKAGAEVEAGTVLATLDAKEAQKSVRDAARTVADAQLSLADAKLSLQKLTQPDADTVLKLQNALNQAQRDLDELKSQPDAQDVREAEADVALKMDKAKMSSDGKTPQLVRDAYDDAASALKSASRSFQTALNEADEVLGIDNKGQNDGYQNLLSVMNSGMLPIAEQAYALAKTPVQLFKTTADAIALRNADPANIDNAIQEAQKVAERLEMLMDKVHDVLMNTIPSSSFSQSTLDGLRTTIQSNGNNMASLRSSLMTQVETLGDADTDYATAKLTAEKAQADLETLKEGADAKDIAAAQERVIEAKAALEKEKKGPDTLDIKSSQNGISQRQSSLAAAVNRWNDAKDALADYTVVAPFDGVVGRVDAKVGDQASGSTVIATLLTHAQIANITINEVDASKVKAGQKATLTFDAVPDLTIAGVVSSVDAVGEASQGVVNYGVMIAFQTQDERIKPGMSVSATVVTDVKTDVLLAPSSAVQQLGGSSFVQTLPDATTDDASPLGIASDKTPEMKEIQTGTSNDQQIEITGGLDAGDLIITRTIQPTAAKATTQTGNAIPGFGGTGGARVQTTGAVRAGGGGDVMFMTR